MPPPDGITTCQSGDVCTSHGRRGHPWNALRGHLSEHGLVAPQGPANVKVLAEAIEDVTTSLSLLVVELSRVFLEQIDLLSKKIGELEKTTFHEAARGAITRRLQTMPGVGPITAMTIATFAPPMIVFKRGRDFTAWLGLVPSALDWRQAASRKDLQDGTTRYSAVADHWRDSRRALGLLEGSARRNVAPSHAGVQTTHACCERARKQDGAFDLGHAD